MSEPVNREGWAGANNPGSETPEDREALLEEARAFLPGNPSRLPWDHRYAAGEA